jgi:hypothetical protein
LNFINGMRLIEAPDRKFSTKALRTELWSI